MNKIDRLVMGLYERDVRVDISLDVYQLLATVGTLQLGLKSPENNGVASVVVRELVMTLTNGLTVQLSHEEKKLFAFWEAEYVKQQAT